MLIRVAVALALLAGCVLSQAAEKPAAIILASNGAQVRPLGGTSALTLAKDDYLFPGDTLITPASASADVALCGKGVAYNLPSLGEFMINAGEIRPSKGPLPSPRDYPVCDLKPIRRDLAAASRRGLVHQEEPSSERGVQNQPADLPLGPTYALVVGISEYPKLAEEEWLRFADADARTFADFLASSRGGAIQGEDRVKVLINAEATRDSVRNYIRLYLQRARESHGTFLLLLAAHGIVDKNKKAHLLTYDSSAEELSSSGFPMREFADVLGEGLTGLGQMMIFVDVCHAGKIGTIESKLSKDSVNAAMQSAVGQLEGDIFSFVSSAETEPSFEGPNWGGGHGAFTYFVLRGLNGDADMNHDDIVSARELLDYVGNMVRLTTENAQHPKELAVTMERGAMLSKGDKAVFPKAFETFRAVTKEDLAKNRAVRRGQLSTSAAAGPSVLDQFRAALAAGRTLPGEPQSAYELLRSGFVPASETYRTAATELRIALENQGQAVVLQYLQGDQIQMERNSFRDAARYFAAAQSLANDTASVEGRRLFCEGRYAIFQGDYSGALRLLGSAARIDPDGAYSYNGLGIAYLQQGQFALAIDAFTDAIRLAPYWPYARHNLALTLTQQGQYDRAILAYRDAMKLGPDYSYLPYNLGLLYQKLNRLEDAEESYRLALRIARSARNRGVRVATDGNWQEGSDILNALGSLEAARPGKRRRAAAEALYRDALAGDRQSTAARHNLALLLSRDGPSAEAEKLWREVLALKKDDVAARLELARYLGRNQRGAEAVDQYSVLLNSQNSFSGIRRELAAIYLSLNRLGETRTVLEQALLDAPQSGPIMEDLGDVEVRAGQPAAARSRYVAAEGAFQSKSEKARVRRKLSGLDRTP